MIAVVKQPGVPSQSDRSNDEDIVSKVKNYLFDNSDLNLSRNAVEPSNERSGSAIPRPPLWPGVCSGYTCSCR